MPRAKKENGEQPTAKIANANMTTYLLEFTNGTQKKVTIPSDWKVTFGPLVPGGNAQGGLNGRGALSLRIYENSDRQRAVFTDVSSFRDISIELEERIAKHQREVFQKKDEAGNVKEFVAEGQIFEWIQPDNHKPSIKSLPNLDGVNKAD